MDFELEYNQRVEEIDGFLNGFFIRSDNKFVETINKSMRYSLMASGKRLRPMLLIEFSKLFNHPCTYVVDFAASLEMIHTYSLIHDDLPAMDNDDLRRGKPTNHVVFGEANAILAGDGLLNYAYENIMDSALKDPLNALKYLEAGKIISEASGHKGMILGQIADLMNECAEIDIATLDFINSHKTGDLIRASVMAGAILGGCSKKELELVESIGKNIGMCFQIVDDILDIEGTAKEMGKLPGSDEKNDKTTYPKLLGISKCKEIANELIESSIANLQLLDGDTMFIEGLIRYIGERKK
jgi:geranylgeranyl diphosphate synthase type II